MLLENMIVNPIPDSPASIINKELVLADLHIGIKKSYEERGIRIPSQTEEILKRIERITRKNNIDSITLLGDVKNEIPKISWQERDEIPKFLEKISDFGNVKIIPGNHDGNIDKLIPNQRREKFNLYGTRGFVNSEKDVGFVHGHTWPNPDIFKSSKILMGHSHPIIEFSDKLSSKYREKCWIKMPLKRGRLEDVYGEKIEWGDPEIIIQPAFSNLVGGSPFNSSRNSLLGPVFNSGSAILDEAEIYLLDGTYLGNSGNLPTIEGHQNKK